MRLFCGISLVYEVRRNLELLLAHLRPHAAIAWSPVENLHITTKFIGEWPDDRVDEIRRAMAGAGSQAVPIRIRGLGWFPNPHQPRIFFAGVEDAGGLMALARETAAALEALGLPVEDKPYQPHLTLARIKGGADLAALRQAIAQLPSTGFGEFVAARHLLYRSRPGPSGSVYSVEADFTLPAVVAGSAS